MTEKEKEVLDYIVNFKQVNGYSPSILEIAKGVNTKSTPHIREMLADLREKGFITYKDNKSRTICVLRFDY